MSESYKELIVKKDMGTKEIILRALCVTPTVVFLLASLIGGIIPLVLAIACGVLTYFVWLMTDLEFEYLYLEKELTIDKVMAKSKRKRVMAIEVERMEIIAPTNSHQLDGYRAKQGKKTDCSAGKDLPEMKLYTIYYDGGQSVDVNLTEDILKMIKMVAPRKVYLD